MGNVIPQCMKLKYGLSIKCDAKMQTISDSTNYTYLRRHTNPYQGQHPQKQVLGSFHRALEKQAANKKTQIRYCCEFGHLFKINKTTCETNNNGNNLV